MDVHGAIVVLAIILLVAAFSDVLSRFVDCSKKAAAQVFTGSSRPHCDEHLDQPVMAAAPADVPPKVDPKSAPLVPPNTAALKKDGYVGADVPWEEVVKVTELDPSIAGNHADFVKDVRRFSSGANFTSTTDDNTNIAFTNFLGLRRPQHVPIGANARQQPDIDETVLMRNPDFRWGNGPVFNKPLLYTP